MGQGPLPAKPVDILRALHRAGLAWAEDFPSGSEMTGSKGQYHKSAGLTYSLLTRTIGQRLKLRLG